ncbi:hypothetical protein BKA56DRAFT_580728 [Ilyonectria sp. MPI-CAGE-AT-0026]|nr:hypothetical protein BKA56DRAFT_580728 [Ilyonectria sp. MPI-CAGE-AT-0026]
MAAGIQGKWHVANGLVGSLSQEINGYRQRKRKRSPAGTLKAKAQQSPFSLSGTLVQDELIDHYTVEPRQQWDTMSRYNSFILKDKKFERGDFVLVANETTLKRANNARDSKQTTGELSHFWIAYILEIRAADKNKVFARVYWIYWPDKLPPGTFNGKGSIRGRQPYHGRNKLIASNYIDVIDILCVEGPASVKQWMESSDNEFNSDFFWRQRFDCHQKRLTSAEPICRCELPTNSHRRTIGCSRCVNRSNCQGGVSCSDAETDGQETLAMMSKGMDILEAIVSRLLAQLLEYGYEDKQTKTVAREPSSYRTLLSPFEMTLKFNKGTIVVEIKNLGKEGLWYVFLAEVHCLGCGGPMR